MVVLEVQVLETELTEVALIPFRLGDTLQPGPRVIYVRYITFSHKLSARAKYHQALAAEGHSLTKPLWCIVPLACSSNSLADSAHQAQLQLILASPTAEAAQKQGCTKVPLGWCWAGPD